MDNNNLEKTISNKYNFSVHTFGCKVNTYDTGLLQKNLTESNRNYHLNSVAGAENKVHVLNTCAVTAEATSQAVRLIRKIKSVEPLATIVVTGCAAQVDTGAFSELPSVDLVVANSHKGLLPQILDQYFKNENKEKVFKSNIFRKEDLEAGGGSEAHHTRSFLKIQDGCNSFCSFCIIPYARGKSRSISIKDIVLRVNEIYNSGVQEVVLTGVHIGDYLDESIIQNNKLEDLVEAVLKKTKIPRLRLSSLEPIEITDKLLSLFEDERLCKHFHMSIQSATSSVLKQMKRNYSEEDVSEALIKIRNLMPSAYIGMDVIAGFPSETEEDFENTFKLLSSTPWTRLHVFPYSERSGTRAAIMPQLNRAVRKNRAQKLRELSLHREQEQALKQIGQIKKSLVLNKFHNLKQAVSRDYWDINLNLLETNHESFKNKELDVKIVDVQFSNQGDIVLKGNVCET